MARTYAPTSSGRSMHRAPPGREAHQDHETSRQRSATCCRRYLCNWDTEPRTAAANKVHAQVSSRTRAVEPGAPRTSAPQHGRRFALPPTGCSAEFPNGHARVTERVEQAPPGGPGTPRGRGGHPGGTLPWLRSPDRDRDHRSLSCRRGGPCGRRAGVPRCGGPVVQSTGRRVAPSTSNNSADPRDSALRSPLLLRVACAMRQRTSQHPSCLSSRLRRVY